MRDMQLCRYGVISHTGHQTARIIKQNLGIPYGDPRRGRAVKIPEQRTDPRLLRRRAAQE